MSEFLGILQFVDISDFQSVTKMIQEACTYVEKTPNLDTKLKLIDTLRTVTAGKVRPYLQ